MNSLTLTYSVDRVICDDNVQKVKGSFFYFPNELMNYFKDLKKDPLAAPNVNVFKKYGITIDVDPNDKTIKIYKEVSHFVDKDFYVTDVYIEIPNGFSSYMSLIIEFDFSEALSRMDCFYYLQKNLESSAPFNDLVKKGHDKLSRKLFSSCDFSKKKVSAFLRGDNNLQNKLFKSPEIFVDNADQFRFRYSADLGMTVFSYRNRNSYLYEDKDFAVSSIIFIKNRKTEKKYKISSMNIEQKLEGINNTIASKCNVNSVGDIMLSYNTFPFKTPEGLGEMNFYFDKEPENGVFAKISFCDLSGKFAKYGLGVVDLDKTSSQGVREQFNGFSKILCFQIINIIIEKNIPPKEMVRFIKEVGEGLTEPEIFDLLEINYLNGSQNRQSRIKDIEKVLLYYEKIEQILRKSLEANKALPEIKSFLDGAC